ncbi:MAG: zf-HC2 domain-containing protein [Roseburia sp.]|nr:zf-HC2 domain-containing protein [Ruminococcus sp.]MCM1155802.1 zf-HC2 domain-containing protein [Roseburia sp.]MCM1242722.1 zf-HC2 domain-containing protein [Roseburia sp.]
MDCKEEEKMIPAFLQDDLYGRELEEFIEHIETCPECREELSIQFLVSEGLERLEAGNNFNLQKALENKLNNAWHQVKIRRGLLHTLLCLEVAAAVEILIVLIIIFRF